ncbi:MAG: flagellar biosynthesis protein FlhF [Planctomycetota bacterium]|nr:MAG: flagellar biosynthesis protein FlhF [Planctomycetota bacterium]
MNLKTYQGNSMSQALERVKADLGGNAVILDTRTIKTGGLLGVGRKTVVEITAGRDSNTLSQRKRPPVIPDHNVAFLTAGDVESRPAGTLPAEGTASRGVTEPIAEPAVQQNNSTLWALQNQIGELRTMVSELLSRPASASVSQTTIPDVPEELSDYYKRLIQNAVAEEIACEVIAKAKDRLAECRNRLETSELSNGSRDDGEKQMMAGMVHGILVETIEKMLPPVEPIRLPAHGGPKCVALVGPTGVGKTTTIAKLAAHLKLRQNLRVGLITIDTYRIAAVDQLKTYADILNVPLQIVITLDQMREALSSLADRDVVLIDTSGRSQNDKKRLQELKTFLEAAGNSGSRIDCYISDNDNQEDRFCCHGSSQAGSLETHLVLSCTAHPKQLIEVAEKFGILGIDRVVFTKLDEAVGLGVILNVISRTNLKLSYLSTGQDVPDDIEVGHLRQIAEMVLNRDAESFWEQSRDRTADRQVAMRQLM